MKTKRSMTPTAREANWANGKKAAGATTERGKSAASGNAIKHGFFAGELVLADEEKREMATLRDALRRQLCPATALQQVAFARILACIPRCMLALRMETRSVSKALDGSDGEPREPEAAAPNYDWYLAGPAALREGMRLLRDLQAEFQQSGRVDPKWEGPLDAAFGVAFRQSLTQWKPANQQAALLAYSLTEQARIYNMPLPPLEKAPADGSSAQPATKYVLDPAQMKEMVLKLIELRQSVLNDLWRSADQRGAERAQSQNNVTDFAPRYFTTATRDLERAVAWYVELQEKGL